MDNYTSSIKQYTICIVLLILFQTHASSFEYKKISSRSTHIDETSGIELRALSQNSINRELNSNAEITVQLLQNGSPLTNANVSWFVQQSLPSSNTQQGASFIINGATNVLEQTTQTDSNGQTSVTVFVGNVVSQFTVRAEASELLSGSLVKQEFQITAGLGAAINTGTPEQELANTLDSVCPELLSNQTGLSPEQQALLERCTELQNAIVNGQTEEAATALREISPEEVAVQSAVTSTISGQQMANIASRLSAVRRGSESISLGQFALKINDQVVPSYVLTELSNSLFSVDENQTEIPGLLSNRLGLFVNGNYSVGTRDNSNNEDGFEFDSYGLTFGGDYRLRRNSFVGVAIGLSKSEVNISNNGANLDANGKNIALYGSHYVTSQFYLDSTASFGNLQYDMKRNINYTLGGNQVQRVASSDTQGNITAISAGGGYELNDKALLLSLFAHMNYAKSKIDSFTETGGEELNLSIDEQKLENLSSSVGAQVSYAHSTRWAVLIPFLSFSWEHEFKNDANQINGRFANSNQTSNFTVNTEKLDANYFSSAQGISLVLPRGISTYFRFETIVGREFYAVNNFSFGGRWEVTF